jgi:hypothetical protein
MSDVWHFAGDSTEAIALRGECAEPEEREGA